MRNPKRQQDVKAYHGRVLVARFLHEALVLLPIARVSGVKFVCGAILLQRSRKVVFVLEGVPKAEMSKSIAWVKTERFALFRYHSVPIVLDSKHRELSVGVRRR